MPTSHLCSKKRLIIFCLALTLTFSTYHSHAFPLGNNCNHYVSTYHHHHNKQSQPSVTSFRSNGNNAIHNKHKQHQLVGGGVGRSQVVRVKHEFNTWRLRAGFFDDLVNGKLFSGESSGDDKKNDDDDKKEAASTTNDGTKDSDDTDDLSSWSEADFRNEVQSRDAKYSGNKVDSDSKSSPVPISSGSVAIAQEKDEERDETEEFNGYAMRDVIYNKWGVCYDIDFQPVMTFGFRDLYLNVLPFRLGGKKFRHETELDYLCHLQAVVEILVKYDQLEYILAQIEETNKKPRAGTSPLVAVPLRLELTETELNSILQ